jgi:hypothetical protein
MLMPPHGAAGRQRKDSIMNKSTTASKAASFGMAAMMTIAMLMAIDALSFTGTVAAEWAKAPATQTARSCPVGDAQARG